MPEVFKITVSRDRFGRVVQSDLGWRPWEGVTLAEARGYLIESGFTPPIPMQKFKPFRKAVKRAGGEPMSVETYVSDRNDVLPREIEAMVKEREDEQ